MGIPTVNINELAVIVSGIVGMIIGAFWYSPMVFGNLWMKLSKISKKQIDAAKKKGMAKEYIISFIGILVMACVLAYLIAFVGASTIGDVIYLAFLLWLGFIATTMISAVLWEGKSWKLYFLNILHYLIVLFVMALILVWWP